MNWLDSFNQEVQEAQQEQEQESPPIAPAQLPPEIQKEPILPVSVEGQNGDWLTAFDTQVQEAQKSLEVPQADKSGKTFDDWFDEKYSGTKEFLEASGESMVQLGYGAVSFLPSYGLGFATMLNEKLKNVLRQDRIEETVGRGGFPVSPQATDLARKPMAQRLEEAKIKTPKEIRALADKSSEFFASVMGEPITPGGKKVIGKAGELMEWLFHYPKLADEKLAKAGYPNLGYLTGFAGEMLLLKGLHGAAKKGKKVSKTAISRFIKTVEDVKDIKTPAQLNDVRRQVDKILDQLGISEEQRIIATDKTFRTQRDVGSWLEERAGIRRGEKPETTKTKAEADVITKDHLKETFNLSDKEATEIVTEVRKEVPSAKEITREAKAPSVEKRPEQKEAERIRLRDAEKDRLEAPKERKLEELPKPEVELPKPSVRKLNVEEQFGKRVAGEVSDGIKVAEDMAVFETIRAGVEGKKKVGGIMKEVKESRYYEEDLKDFGYSERDLRNAIRAVKVREFGDVKIGKEIKTRLGKEVEKVEKVKESKSKEPRVDIAEGRPAGVEADLKKYERPSRVKEELAEIKIRKEVETAPLRTAEGKLVGSKVLAMRMAKSRKLVGEVVRTPDGKGWYVKKTKEMKAKEVEVTKKFWDSMLEEEGLGVVDVLKSERGSVILQSETIKKLRSSVKRRKIREADIVAEMQRRKVPNSQILRAFPNAFKKTAVEGTSEFLKKGQDPGEFMARRVLKKGKPGKPGRLAPAVTRGDAHTVATFTKDMPRPIFGEKVRTLATSEGLFTQLGRIMKDTFYYPMRKAAKAENDFVTTLVKESNQMKKTFAIGTRQRHAERIEKYSIAQQKDGRARLKAQGVTDIPKELTPKEKIVYDAMQKIYKSLFIAINKAREAAGQRKFPPVENYSPWFHDMVQISKYEKMDILTDLGRINKAMSQLREIPSQIEKVSRAPGLAGHEKFRAGPETPGYLHLNAFDNFNAYTKLAGRAIHIGPTTAYLHELLLPRYKLAENAPNTWRFISDWLDYQKGHEPIMFIENPVTRRRMGELSSNVAVSYISYVWSSILNQTSSLNNTIALIGFPRTVEGIVRLMNPYEHQRASKTSDVLTVRSPEAVLMEAGRPHPMLPGKAGRTVSDVWRKTKTVGTLPLTVVDGLIAKLSWLGSDAKAAAIYKSSETYKKLPTTKQVKALKDFRKHFADDVVEQAQGSAARAARSPFQRTAEGKAMATLQTFVIANFDFLSRQVLGIKNPDITSLQQVQRLTRYVASTAAIAYAFDFMGMRSPVPDPVKAAKEEVEKLGYVTDMEKYTKVSKAVGMEMLEYIPIYGGKFKYGSELGGVLINELVRLGKGDTTAIPRLLGIPGFNQFLKSYRAAERGGTDIDVIFGRYIKKPKKGRVRRSQRSGR